MKMELIVAVLMAAPLIGALIMIWHRLSSKSDVLSDLVDGHKVRIEDLEKGKADVEVLVNLAKVVEEMGKEVTSHHTDTNKHRTSDFEKRFDQLIIELTSLSKSNTAEHQAITNLILERKS